MTDQVTSGGIDPDYLYTPALLAERTGLGRRQVVEMMDDGRLNFVPTGRVRGRRIRGQQYLDWLAQAEKRGGQA